MKSKKWSGSKKKLPSSEQQEDTIQRFNHEPFNPTTSCGEFEVKPEKIHELVKPKGSSLKSLKKTQDKHVPSLNSEGSSNPRSAFSESRFSKGLRNPKSALGESRFSKGLQNPRSALALSWCGPWILGPMHCSDICYIISIHVHLYCA
ncbi:hypothetical protein HKD37_03G006905 [Glycine soja]